LASKGHALALGGPGSGKTHVSLVKARDDIRAGVLKDGQKILFLSFARATVARIIEKASELISREELQWLEINTYHSFAWSILKSHSYLLNGKTGLQLLPPPEASAHLADIDEASRASEKERLFFEEGRLHFDLFARLTANILASSRKLTHIYCDAYPTIILDEFQDTDADQWSMIRQLGLESRLIALGDPDQRIYEFRGADPARLGDFVKEFTADTFDFTGENHRSSGTDITTFANHLLAGANKGKLYNEVKVLGYRYYKGRSAFYSAKTGLIQALRRLSQVPDHSIAVLVPSRSMMLGMSDYLDGDLDGLPSIGHDVAMDAEPPALAAGVIASLLAGGPAGEVASRMVTALHTHIRGRGGRDGTPQAELELAGALGGFLATGRIRGPRRQLIVAECQRIATVCAGLQFSGNPEEDWLTVRHMLRDSTADALVRVAVDGRFLRLLHRGSALRTTLGSLWRTQGHYAGAVQAVKDALLQEHFAAAQTKARGIHVMTMHKSKGKEFDEVIIYEGQYFGRLMKRPNDARVLAQDRLTLLVAVTRAMKRATILTPAADPSKFFV
jgi:DNA helicase II / ATP-dependent DNA helicase PcrA